MTLGHTNYILRMTDPNKPFYVLYVGGKKKLSVQLLSEKRKGDAYEPTVQLAQVG